jgi:IclR family acetate operon transcriptional repressor
MNKYHIPNLDNACLVIDLIANTPQGCALKDISAKLDIPRTSALRIVQTLLHRNFLDKNEDGAFTLGTALVHVGVMALDSLDIRGFARPVLRKLSHETGESSHIAMLNGDKSLLVEVCDSPHPVRIASRPGTLVDLHSSSTGKIFLAYCIPEPAEFCRALELTQHTPNTSISVEAVLADIEQTRKQGYAMDEEEYVPGARCIAAPILNAFEKTIAAIGITASCSTFSKTRIPAMSDRLRKAAAEISSSMGFSHYPG